MLTLAIGSPVWFHSRKFPEFTRPRFGFVQPGAQANLFNLIVFGDVLLDITNNRQPPILTRRNVLVFDDYPQEWPLEDFAVFVTTARAPYEAPRPTKEGEAPEYRAKIVAGRATHAERPRSNLPEVTGEVTEAGLNAAQATVAEIPRLPTKPDPRIPPAPPAKEPPKDTTEAVQPRPPVGKLHGAMQRLQVSPPFLRAIDAYPDVSTTGEPPDSIWLHNPKVGPKPIVRLTHEPEGDLQGYRCIIAGVVKAEGVTDAARVGPMLLEAFRVANEGVSAAVKVSKGSEGTPNGKHTPKKTPPPTPPAKGKGKGRGGK